MILVTLLKDYVKPVANWVTNALGYFGIFMLVLIADFIIVPIFPTDSIFAVTTDMNPVLLLTVMTTASILAGFLGYLTGKNLGKTKIVRSVIPVLLKRGRILMRRNAIVAVAIAGLTPLPFAMISWLAGYLHVKPLHYFIGALFRIPRYIIYYLIVAGSINLFVK